MHRIEAIIAEHRSSGVALRLDVVDGVDGIVAETEQLSRSPFASDLVALLIADGAVVPDSPAAQFIIACFRNAADPLTLLELSDYLEPLARLDTDASTSIFEILVGTFSNRTASGLLRRAALFGALGFALGVKSRELRIASALLDADLNDFDHEAAAKAIGLVWSRVREADLVRRLSELVEAGSAGASYELGCAKLVQALEGASLSGLQAALSDAHASFQHADASGEVTSEAQLMRLSVEALLSLVARTEPIAITAVSEELRKHAFYLMAVHGSQSVRGWQRAERETIVCWCRMALTIDALAKRLWEPSWWQPAAVIGEELLRVYSASRSFFRGKATTGLEDAVRPVIEASVFKTAGQLHQVREWLRHNPADSLSEDASELIAQVERLGEAASTIPSADRSQPAQSNSPPQLIARLMSALSTGFDASMPAGLRITLEDWLQQIEGHPDIQANLDGRIFLGQVVFFSLRFLHWCTDISGRNDVLSSYLFQRSADDLPHENALQRHFHAMLSGWMGPMGFEVQRVSGGRSDVVFSLGTERFVVEVKRELVDASPDALFATYGGQTEEYQNASWRLSLLLVLDLTRDDGKGLHIRDAVASRSLTRAGESASRTVFLMRIAGRRLVPSDLTKVAKSKMPSGAANDAATFSPADSSGEKGC